MAKPIDADAEVMSNAHAGSSVWLMTLKAPEIAETARPGQFVHMKIPGLEAHILRRPFGVYEADGRAGTISIMYQTVGEGTRHLRTVEPGAICSLIGPIGTGWSVPEGTRRALIVAGGVGSAPLLLLTRELVADGVAVTAVLGAQTKEALVALDAYRDVLGCDPLCSTDDGSFGREGFCTSLVEEALAESASEATPFDYIACCGPEPLMRIVADMARRAGVICEVSLERRMACGIGACLSCVVETVDGKKRACVDGPVFASDAVVWS